MQEPIYTPPIPDTLPDDWGKPQGGGGEGGTDNYNDLTNKPKINGTTLAGDKTAANLGLATTGQVNSAVSAATQASSDVATLRTAVTANTTNITSLSNRTGTLETTVSGLSTTVGTHTTQISSLQTSKANTSVTDAIDSRVTALEASDPASSISALQARMTTAESDIDSLQTDKANVTVTNSLQVSVTALQTTKANQADLTALQTVVGQKASQSDVTTLTTTVDTLTADSTTVGSVDYKIQQAMATAKSYKEVATLPTASASTQGAIYIISAGQPDSGQMYITVEDGSSYSWYNVGGADSIDLSGYVKVVDLNAYKQTVTTAIGAVDTKADTNTADIASLSDTVDTKADESDLQQLAARVGVNETNIALKASQADLTAIDTRVTTAEGAIAGLASSKQDVLTFDSTPTEDSANPVKSSGVYDALATKATTTALNDVDTAKQDKQLASPIPVAGVQQTTVFGTLAALAANAVTTVDDALSTSSENPVQNKLVTTGLNSKISAVTVMPATPLVGLVVLYVGTTGTYTQGTMYQWDGTNWVQLSTQGDLSIYQTKQLVTPVTILDVQYNTVEDAIGAINSVVQHHTSDVADIEAALDTKQPKTLATPITIGGTSRTTVETALSALNSAKQEAAVNINVGGLPYYSISAAIGALDTNKAERATGATAGNFASLDANGNLTDSGISKDIVPSDASSSNNKLVTADKVHGVPYVTGTIQTSTNFNDFKSPIVIFLNNIRGGYSNAPTSGTAFTLIVRASANNGSTALSYITQMAIEYYNGDIYTRTFNPNDSRWASWRKEITSTDLTSSVTSGSTAPITSGGVYLELRCPFESSFNVDNVFVGQGVSKLVSSALSQQIYMGTVGNMITIRTGAYSEERVAYTSSGIVRTTVSGTLPYTATIAGSLLALSLPANTRISIQRIM